MKKTMIVSMVLLLVAVIQYAFAHHAWVEREGDRFFVGWGHPPKIDPYTPQRVKNIKAFDLKGREVALTRTDEKERVYLSPTTDVSMIVLSFEGGYVVSTPEGKKRMTKREAQKAGLQIIDSFFSNQFAKSLFGYSDAIMKPVNMKFEIVPLKNPFTLKPDETLSVKVLFDGKPAEGVIIETGYHKEAGKTNAEGIAEVKIAGQGMEVIVAKHRIAVKDNPDTDYMSFTTVLTWGRDGAIH